MEGAAMRARETTIGKWAAGAWWTAWWAIVALLSVAVAVTSYRYLPRMGPLPQPILDNPFANPWLNVHVAGSATALLLGALQFIPPLRRHALGAHRWIGRLYVLGALSGGVGGLFLAFGTFAGPIAGAGFASAAIIWIAVNGLGWRAALRGRFAEHRRWMIRSWSLALAAVTLRLYMLLPGIFGFPDDVAYVASSFLCWVPNLMIAEIYLRMRATRGLVTVD
jgi:uncharacterized membrane protein